MILEKIAKEEKWKKSGQFGFLRRSVGHSCRGVALRRSVGCPLRGEAGVPKWHPLGKLWRSTIHGGQISIFVSKASYSYTDSLRTLIND